jgi:hypothetical protein
MVMFSTQTWSLEEIYWVPMNSLYLRKLEFEFFSVAHYPEGAQCFTMFL